MQVRAPNARPSVTCTVRAAAVPSFHPAHIKAGPSSPLRPRSFTSSTTTSSVTAPFLAGPLPSGRTTSHILVGALCIKYPTNTRAVSTSATASSNSSSPVTARMASAAAGSATAGAGSGRRIILWFRNDLRLHDNYCADEVVKKIKAKEFDEVVPLYVYDPRFFARSPFGPAKTGAFRAQFTREAVADLQASLRARGSDLLVAVGKPEEVIGGLVAGCVKPPLVLTAAEVTSEERSVDSAVERTLGRVGGRLQRLWGHTLYHLDDLQGAGGPFSGANGIKGMPDVFTPFKEKCEQRASVRREVPTPGPGALPLPAPTTPTALSASGSSQLPEGAAALGAKLGQLLAKPLPEWGELPWPDAAPALPTQHAKAVLPFKGGESVALARLKYYLWDTDLIATYFDTRNGMLGGDYSTKFAPWMALGCLSPRTIYHQIKKYEAERTSNKSTYWVVFELLWRDFYRFFAIKHGSRIFFESGTSGKQLKWAPDQAALYRAWAEGRTGLPLVDANMRELKATGFMSNRGRQNVASHLVIDLGVDWRKGGALFEELLLDYDVTSNWGNWVAAAGLTGGRLNAFNITKQSKDYDPEGDYIRTWVPELSKVPGQYIHEPWLMSREAQAKYGVEIGVTYPAPAPVARWARPHHNSEGRDGRPGSGRGGSGGRGGYSGGRGSGGGGGGGGYSAPAGGSRPYSARGGAGSGAGRGRPRSEFERFG